MILPAASAVSSAPPETETTDSSGGLARVSPMQGFGLLPLQWEEPSSVSHASARHENAGPTASRKGKQDAGQRQGNPPQSVEKAPFTTRLTGICLPQPWMPAATLDACRNLVQPSSR
ncbi:hypothetical protein G6O67_002509 [Ophiocordyceps sinensis]|uniref:Uncharacterized protein n=1 Tax=Ophiocordyceps sinensis TaxID=72228 RepID=A0A8H4V7B1_9HYPO|nr:hypothetical protein G6O67_002509 [Ophiocordyceps sinensis]